MNLDDADDRDVAAGEYVLGTLAGDDRDRFVRALASDHGLQGAVYAWQDRLLGLAQRAAPETPPAELWRRIEGKLSDLAVRAVSTGATKSANDSFWNRAAPWRWATAAALAATTALAVLLVERDGPPSAGGERYLAVLQSPDAERATGWVVEATAGQRVRLVPVGAGANVTPPAGKALQFWTKPEGAAGPTSLGLVRAGAVAELAAARLPSLSERQLFEVTLEPEGGSTIGRPTGPVLFVGSTVRLGS